MRVALNFRQAILLSLALHLVLLPVAGWLAGGWLKAHAPIEQIIELELAGGESAAGGGNGGGSPGQAAGATPAAMPVTTLPVLPSDGEQSSMPQPDSLAEAAPLSEQPAAGIPEGTGSSEREGSGAGTGSGFGSGAGSGSGSGSGTGGTGSGSGAGGESSQRAVIPPRVLERIEPEYPLSARRKNLEGTVGLRIEILPNGLPGDIRIANSSGYEVLDLAAEQAVRSWRFIPARNTNGTAIRSVTVLSIAFRLR